MTSKKLKIVVACDKYKGSLTAFDVCTIIRRSILDLNPDIDVVVNPMADGGDGTVDTLVKSLSGEYVHLNVTGPLGENIKSYFGLIDNKKTAVIEMSLASGLSLIPPGKKDPLSATTFGTGELIKKALDMSCRKIIIGIGGSATNDAGMGALQALGVKFFDRNKKELGFGGSGLIKLDFIDAENIHQGVRDTEIFIACDVDNPLYGKNGAAFVYAPQKGADSSQVVLLDSGLRNFSSIVKNQFGRDVSRIKGAGAAGGLGAGLAAFLNAKIKSGTDLIITATELESKIKDADLVITGEGAMDFQTFFGKTPFGVASLAAKYGISVITINGSVDIDYNKIKKSQLDLFSGNFDIINRAMNIGEAMSSAEANLYRCVKEITKFYLRTVGAD